ncbi:MAG: insulinase family protein [Bacilli bacterium]|nr:insulinase family protein [Bacilli bacterium]
MDAIKYTINNLDVYHIQTKKFKTIVAGIVFTSVLTKQYLAEKVLLSSMLVKTCEKFPKEQDYLKYLRDKYDTNIFADVSKRGKTLQVMFGSNIVNAKFLNEKIDLFQDTLEILKNTLLNPYLIDGNFSSDLLNEEKNLLIDEIKTQYSNNRLQAIVGLIENMFKNEEYQIYSGLKIEDVEKVTVETLTKAYYELLKDNAYCFVIGDVEKRTIGQVFGEYSAFKTINTAFEYIDYEDKIIEQVNEVIVEKSTNQSVVVFGYRTNIRLFDEYYYPMCVFNGMLGGFFHSKLTTIIREEEGLAYYILSEYASQKGYLTITSGINFYDYNQVKEKVLSIVEDFKNGLIDENILLATKETIVNGILESDDSFLGLLNDVYRKAEYPSRLLDLKTRIDKINEVKLEDIIVVANALVLDTIFVLKGCVSNEEVL